MIRFFILLLLFSTGSVFGQEYTLNENLSIIQDCGGFITDSGSSMGNYQNNEFYTTTICKNPREGTHIKLTFSELDLGTGDKLCFFDGNNASADSILCVSAASNGIPFIVQATAANSSGCLTLQFSSDGSDTGTGWEGIIDCIPSCQLIQAEITSTNPPSDPLENGWIDVCIGERISFSGQGLFPQDGLVYDHSDQTSRFEWDFGDGTTAVGPNVTHVFNESGGYRVTLSIVDQFGCQNGNFAFQRVRVATKPDFIIGELPAIVCLGDSIILSGGTSDDNMTSTVEVSTNEGAFIFNGVRSDSLALPDGNGASYKTSIRFTDFAAGQVLTDLRDLQSICVNMEHSWLHDMEISITCPSGKTVLLQNQEVINKEVYLGIPVDNDGINPQSGIGKEYCWTPFTNNGTITEFIANDDDSGANDTYFLPSGLFNSFEDLEALLGCPLNGDWVITVTDLWEQDNGWIFSWSIDINPNLYPKLETFEPEIIDFQWQNNPDIIDYSPEVVIAQPSSAGTTNFVFEASDNYGCTHDTSIQIAVLPFNHPDCLNCDDELFKIDNATICSGESLDLGPFIDTKVLGTEEFVAFPDFEFSFSTHPPGNPFESTLQIQNVPGNEINVDGSNLVNVCLDLTSTFNADLSITLVSPNGVHLDLSSENGGRNQGYLNTCFTASAPKSITDEEDGPFTGDYRPEEPFANFAGTDINGVWTLKLSDDTGMAATDVNVLNSWSMTFLSPNGATFTWENHSDLSCTDCINPTATPITSSTYILEKDFEGCIVKDTFIINVLSQEGPSDIQEYSLPDGKLLVNWQAVPNATGYQVSTNRINWIPSIGDFYHIFEGLSNQENFIVYVKAIFGDFGCESNPRSRAVLYSFCDLEISLAQSSSLITSCLGTEDAFVVVAAENGTPPYIYTLNDSISGTNNRFDNLGAGDYSILVEDASNACADTLTFAITSPPSLKIDFVKKDLDCFGDANGRIEAFPSGGVGGFSVVQWNHSASQDFSVTNLAKGNYWVTIADAKNCTVVDTIEIVEPKALKADTTQSPVSCFGLSDGRASVKVTDGTPPYRFNWDDGQTGNSAIGLPIGTYEVTVTDANECSVIRSFQVKQPPPLSIDFQEQPISCKGESNAALLATGQGGVPPYDYLWNTGQANQFVFGLAEGNYFLTLTDSRGCTEEVRRPIGEPSEIAISVSTTPTSCNNQNDGTATLNIAGGAAPYTFQWNDVDSQRTQTAIDLAPDDYEVTISDALGCQNVFPVTIEPAAILETTITSVSASCADRADGEATITAIGGSGTYNYFWDNGNNVSNNTGLLPGKYQVVVFDSNQCQTTDSVEITAPPLLKIDSIVDISPNCFGENSGELQAFVSGGTTPYNFNWDNGQENANPYIGAAGGMHSLQITDANGCVLNPVDFTLTEPLPIALVLDSTDVSCFGGSDGSVNVTVTGGISPFSYSWDDSENQNTQIAINLSAGIYEVTIKDNNDCTQNASISIQQPISPILSTFVQTDTSCFHQNQNHARINASGGTGPGYTYEWDTGETTNVAVNLTAGMHWVSITDENNCLEVDTFNVVEFDSISFSINEVKPKCVESEDGQLAITPISGGAGDGISANYEVNWNTAPSVSQDFISNLIGNKTYRVTVTDQMGCEETINHFLEAPDSLFLELEKNDISCTNFNNGLIRVQSFSGSQPIMEYLWSDNVPNSSMDNAINLSAGFYYLTVVDIDGCIASATTEIIEPRPIQILDAQIIPNICRNEMNGQVLLAVNGGTGDYEYNWSDGSTLQNLINAPSGNYQVSITDENNCELTQSYSLIDPEALEGSVAIEPISCAGDNDGRLTITTSGGVPPYSYSLDGKNFNGIDRIVGLTADNYTVFIKDQKDCIWKSSSILLPEPNPFSIDIESERTTIQLGDTTTLIANFINNNGNLQYSWSSNGLDSNFCEQSLCDRIAVSPTVNTIYEVYAVDENGCEALERIQISVSKTKNIFVPTGFSPNQDGNNDLLVVHGREGTTIQSFTIFDRWGETVYEAKDLIINDDQNGWDGTFKGQPLNTGVYVWVLEIVFADGSVELFKGSTTLIR